MLKYEIKRHLRISEIWYHVPDTVLGVRDVAVNKTNIPILTELIFWRKEYLDKRKIYIMCQMLQICK